MAERGVAAMHPNFARWYAEVRMDGSARAERWSGIEEIVANIDRDYVEVLVRLAFGTKPPAGGNKEPRLAEKLAALHATFRSHDETYDPGATREIQVLAASVLAQLFNSYALAPLAVTTAAVAGGRKPDLPMDLLGLAENAIRALGQARRRRPDLRELRASLVDVPYKVDVSGLNAGDPATFGAPIEGLRAAAEKAIKTMGDRLNESIQRMAKYIEIADEELQMLWWVVGGKSLDLGLSFDKVKAAAQPLVFGRELADRTIGPPGPVAVSALLSRAGLKSRGQVGIVGAIGAVEDAWVTDALDGVDASPVTSPIHFALEKRVETGAGEAWVPGWAAISGLSQDHGVAPATLGELFYRERVLLKFGA